MAHPLNAKIAGVVFACFTSVLPVAALAQGFDAAPSGSFTFGNFGSTQVDNLPLELSDDSIPLAPRLPTTVVELGTAPVLADVRTRRVQTRRIQQTWSIGVFR